MNNELEKPRPNDEVDLGQLFNAIGRMFDRFFSFIGAIFAALFGFIIFILKVVIDNIKLICAVVIIGLILGIGLDKMKTPVYTSQLLVIPYFDSQYQLVNNIEYYNTLIGTQNYKELSEIFGISEEASATLQSFEVKAGPESENDKIKQYDEFKKTLDTANARDFTYQKFLENRNIYSVELYEINVESTKNDIFRSLEPGLNNTFKNIYSARQKEKRDTLLAIQKANIKASLTSIDSLRNVYITVLKNDSKNGSSTISFGEGLSLEPNKASKTKEFELLEREIEFRNKLVRLEEIRLNEDSYFDTVSNFQAVGSKTSKFSENYTVLVPLISFLILALIFATFSIIKYIRRYGK